MDATEQDSIDVSLNMSPHQSGVDPDLFGTHTDKAHAGNAETHFHEEDCSSVVSFDANTLIEKSPATPSSAAWDKGTQKQEVTAKAKDVQERHTQDLANTIMATELDGGFGNDLLMTPGGLAPSACKSDTSVNQPQKSDTDLHDDDGATLISGAEKLASNSAGNNSATAGGLSKSQQSDGTVQSQAEEPLANGDEMDMANDSSGPAVETVQLQEKSQKHEALRTQQYNNIQQVPNETDASNYDAISWKTSTRDQSPAELVLRSSAPKPKQSHLAVHRRANESDFYRQFQELLDSKVVEEDRPSFSANKARYTTGEKRSSTESSFPTSQTSRRREVNTITLDTAQMDTSPEGVPIEGDDSWMHDQDPGDDDINTESEKCEALRKKIEARERAGATVSLRDRVELRTLEARQTAQQKRRHADTHGADEWIQEESFFVPQPKEPKEAVPRSQQPPPQSSPDTVEVSLGSNTNSRPTKRRKGNSPGLELSAEPGPESNMHQQAASTANTSQSNADTAGMQSLVDALEDVKKMEAEKKKGQGSTKKKERKKTGPRAKTARQVREKRLEKEQQRAAKVTKKAKKAKGAKGAKGGKPATPQKRSAVSGPSAFNHSTEQDSATEDEAVKKKSRPRKRDYGSGDAAEAADLLINLLRNNAIEDRMNQPDYGEVPIIPEQRRKDRRLEDLIASVPRGEDVNKRQAGIDKKDVLRASRNFGVGKVRPGTNGRWKFKGLKSQLYHHQLLGVDFMVSRELGTTLPHGGLLADSMGLGKTVEILAAIVGNPPELDQGHRKTTLLVVPSGAIKQWEEEIRNHVTDGVFKKIMHYKATKEISIANLEDQDIILTSYGEVMRSYPYPGPQEIKNLDARGIAGFVKESWENRGDLHKLTFYRIVLDEAHAIKNHRSRTSLACMALEGDYRWATTGTPIQNRLEELYPYFRFLKLPCTSNFAAFREHFCDPESVDCNQRVAYVLSFMMIRRTLKDRVFGRPIIELPKAHSAVKRLEFAPEERAIYEVLEDRFRSDLNRWFKEGTAQRNYGNIVVRLLKLRQATSHPFLLQQTMQDIFTLEDMRRLEDKIGKASSNQHFYKQIQAMILEKTHPNDGSGDADVEPDTTPFGRSNFGTNFEFGRYLETLDEKAMIDRCTCHICGDIPSNPQITDCKHVFCKDCIEQKCLATANLGSNYTECPKCRFAFNGVVPHSTLSAREYDLSLELSQSEAQTGEHHGKEKTPRNDWLKMDGDLLPSTKLTAVKAQVMKWLEEAPQDKIVIFTQFHLIVRILKKLCDVEGWSAVEFTGEMDLKARDKARRQFLEDSEVNIMIAGLKCGGIALNLTAANRVISIDLWWNHSVELQAFGRVFRIGQGKETYLTRLAVRNTVDDRMLAMQESKVKIIDGAMMDDGRRVTPLSVTELAKLFGYLTEDEEGNPVVSPDNDEDEEDEFDEADTGKVDDGEVEHMEVEHGEAETGEGAAQPDTGA